MNRIWKAVKLRAGVFESTNGITIGCWLRKYKLAWISWTRNMEQIHTPIIQFSKKGRMFQTGITCWWTSVMDRVICRNNLMVAKTTAPFACWSLSSRRFMMSKISSLSAGTYLETNSKTIHCAHSLNSLILNQSNTELVLPYRYNILQKRVSPWNTCLVRGLQ